MDINRFKKPKTSIDKKTWDTWLSDDIRPASPASVRSAAAKSKSLKPQKLSKPPKSTKSPESPKSPKSTSVSVSPKSPLRRADYQRRYAEGRGILDTASRANTGAAVQPVKPPNNKLKAPAVSVNIQLPQLSKVRVPEWRKLPWQALRPWAFAIGVIALLITGSLVYSWWQNSRQAPAKVQTISATKDMGYKPYTPTGKTVATFGQYDPKKKLYTFNDTYMGSKLTVNQQTMPDKLRDDKVELQKLIDSVGAAESFTTSKGEVYVATDLATGSQRLVVVGTNLLVFIQSTATLENASWVKYLSSLQ